MEYTYILHITGAPSMKVLFEVKLTLCMAERTILTVLHTLKKLLYYFILSILQIFQLLKSLISAHIYHSNLTKNICYSLCKTEQSPALPQVSKLQSRLITSQVHFGHPENSSYNTYRTHKAVILNKSI